LQQKGCLAKKVWAAKDHAIGCHNRFVRISSHAQKPDLQRQCELEPKVWCRHQASEFDPRPVAPKPLLDGPLSASQPLDRVVELINPVLRGWVRYFAIGHSSQCFSFIKDWVEKKARRHLGGI
jgi:hypothetical protein